MTVDQGAVHTFMAPTEGTVKLSGSGAVKSGGLPKPSGPPNDSLSPRLLIAVLSDGARLWRQRSPGTSGYHVLKPLVINVRRLTCRLYTGVRNHGEYHIRSSAASWVR